MPYRHLAPRERPWWEKLAGIWLAGFVVVGLLGIPWPSDSVATVLDVGAYLYAAMLVIFGTVGSVAWWQGRRAAEVVALWSLALLTFLHGLMILVATGAIHTGGRIILAGLGMVIFACTRRAFALSRTQIANIDEATPAAVDTPPRSEDV